MTGRLLTLASATWALLCVAAVALWVRSHYAEDAALVHRYRWTVDRDTSDRNTAQAYYHKAYVWASCRRGSVGFAISTLDGQEGAFWRETMQDRLHHPDGTGFEWLHLPVTGPPPSRITSRPIINRLGFYLASTHGAGLGTVGYDFRAEIPAGVILGITALAAGVPALSRYRRARAQAKAGLCRRCGYDLRASKDRCPECGTPIPATS